MWPESNTKPSSERTIYCTRASLANLHAHSRYVKLHADIDQVGDKSGELEWDFLKRTFFGESIFSLVLRQVLAGFQNNVFGNT